MIILPLALAVSGWVAFFFVRSKYTKARGERYVEKLEYEHRIESLQKRVKDGEPAVAFCEKWKNAPQLQEELEEIKDILRDVSASELSAGTRKEIERIGWGVYHSDNTDYADLMKRAYEKMESIANSGKAVLFHGEQRHNHSVSALLLDAFNGYVKQYILYSNKAYAQRLHMIKLAYFTINLRGQSAYNAEITKEYLDAVLELFRIKTEMEAYKQQQREFDRKAKADEQRQSEQEAHLQKELDRLRARLEKAHEKERARMEKKIAELEGEIEASRRALSNAQLTKRGTVYVISNIGSFGENVFKIGMTRRTEPQERIDELGVASVPFPFDVHAFIPTEDAPRLEYELHEYFKDRKVNTSAVQGREFYRVPLDEVQAKVEALGFSVKWEVLPEAKEYRASAGEKLIAQSAYIQNFADTETMIGHLQEHEIGFVDKRNVGGCFWIESTPDSDSLMASCVVAGKHPLYAKQSKSLGGKPGWFVV